MVRDFDFCFGKSFGTSYEDFLGLHSVLPAKEVHSGLPGSATSPLSKKQIANALDPQNIRLGFFSFRFAAGVLGVELLLDEAPVVGEAAAPSVPQLQHLHAPPRRPGVVLDVANAPEGHLSPENPGAKTSQV